MTLQESNEFFSKPRHKVLILDFEAIDETRIVINDVETTLNENGFTLFELPSDFSGLYTEIVFSFVRTNIDGTTTTINKNVLVSELGRYTGTGILDSTLLDSYSPDWRNHIEVDAGISDNHDLICIYYKATSGMANIGYKISYLSGWAYQPALTIDNPNIVQESLSVTDSLCDSDFELRYGKCEPKSLSISIAYDPEVRLKGRWFNAILSVEAPDRYLVDDDGNRIVDDNGDYIVTFDKNNTEVFFLGRYKVFSDDLKNESPTRELVCYDALYDINNANVRSWIDGLTFPMTLKNFRDSFFSYLGIEQVETTLINDSFSVRGRYGDDEMLSGQTIIESICELNGVFGRMTADGKFEYVSLDTNSFVEYTKYVNNSGDYEQHTTDFVSGVMMRGEDGEIDYPTFVGNDYNVYVIYDNPIVYGAEGKTGTKPALQNLLNKIKNIAYRPFSLKTYGNPVLPAGTFVIVEAKNKTIESLVMTKNLTGIQAMMDVIESYGEEKLTDNG